MTKQEADTLFANLRTLPIEEQVLRVWTWVNGVNTFDDTKIISLPQYADWANSKDVFNFVLNDSRMRGIPEKGRAIIEANTRKLMEAEEKNGNA